MLQSFSGVPARHNSGVMSHGKLAEIVLGQHESIAAHLGEATPEERAAVQQAATDHARGLNNEIPKGGTA